MDLIHHHELLVKRSKDDTDEWFDVDGIGNGNLSQLSSIDEQLKGINKQFDKMGKKLSEMEDKMGKKLSEMEKKLSEMQKDVLKGTEKQLEMQKDIKDFKDEERRNWDRDRRKWWIGAIGNGASCLIKLGVWILVAKRADELMNTMKKCVEDWQSKGYSPLVSSKVDGKFGFFKQV